MAVSLKCRMTTYLSKKLVPSSVTIQSLFGVFLSLLSVGELALRVHLVVQNQKKLSAFATSVLCSLAANLTVWFYIRNCVYGFCSYHKKLRCNGYMLALAVIQIATFVVDNCYSGIFLDPWNFSGTFLWFCQNLFAVITQVNELIFVHDFTRFKKSVNRLKLLVESLASEHNLVVQARIKGDAIKCGVREILEEQRCVEKRFSAPVLMFVTYRAALVLSLTAGAESLRENYFPMMFMTLSLLGIAVLYEVSDSANEIKKAVVEGIWSVAHSLAGSTDYSVLVVFQECGRILENRSFCIDACGITTLRRPAFFSMLGLLFGYWFLIYQRKENI